MPIDEHSFEMVTVVLPFEIVFDHFLAYISTITNEIYFSNSLKVGVNANSHYFYSRALTTGDTAEGVQLMKFFFFLVEPNRWYPIDFGGSKSKTSYLFQTMNLT